MGRIVVVLSLAAALLPAQVGTGGLPAQHRQLINRYCLACHNNSLKTGGLVFNTSQVSVSQHTEVWESVLRRLQGRFMPPPGLPRPDAASYDAIVSYLATTLDAAAAASPNPGRTDTFRRLTRPEYCNAIRDLLALDIDVSSLLPADDVSHGFDNVTVAELSPALLERYLAAAQKISRLAIGSPVRAPGGDTILLPPDLTQEDHFDKLPFGTRGGTAVPYTFPLDGEYEIQLRLTRDRNERIEGLYEPHHLELTIDGQRVHLFTVKPPPRGVDHDNADNDLRVRVPVKAGPRQIAAAFLRKSSALIETERQPYAAHFNMDRHPRIQPALYSISIVGPHAPAGPGDTPSRRRIFVCRPGDAARPASPVRR